MTTYSEWEQRQLDIESGKELDRSPKVAFEHQQEQRPYSYTSLIDEINLLSGRVELQMRLIARIIAKIDPAFIENPMDPEVQRRSLQLERAVIEKMKQEAMMQQANDPTAFQRLQRYFKDIT